MNEDTSPNLNGAINYLKINGVLLASGASRRLGRPKQLLPWQGSVLINKIIDTINNSIIDDLIIVLGYKHDEITTVLDKSHQILINKAWKLGKSEAIKLGLNEIASRSEAVVFFTIDQPFLSYELIDQIAIMARSSGADIIATRSRGVTTVPMLFKNSTFQALLALEGEQGGKNIFTMPQFKSDVVCWNDERILIDIDTQSSYQRALKADLV